MGAGARQGTGAPPRAKLSSMTDESGRNFRARVERALRVDSRSKPKIYAQVYQAAEIGSLNYWLELIFSAGIATLGLVLDSPAVVIGAMLISPLMGPILAAGLALAAGDLYLGIKSVANIVMSVAGAVGFSAAIVWLLPFHAPTSEILSRTHPNLLDLGVAVFSGLAGSFVLCRGGGGGGVTALPGVAIAVALMPPLCTVGFGAGSGMVWPIVSGAGLLFLTNLAAIIASAFLVFLLVRMDAPDVREEIDRSIRERSSRQRLFVLLNKTVLSRSLADVGKLRWRVVMLAAVLAVLFVPLSRALIRVKNETVARGAIREAIRQIAPRESVVSEVADITPDRIRLRLILTDSVPPPRIEQAKNLILKRTGRDVELFVRRVAGEEELALLRERLTAPPPPSPLEDLEGVRRELIGRLDQPLRETWPAGAAALLSYELRFSPEDIVVRVRYQAPAAFDEAAAEVLRNVLRNRLHVEQLRLEMDWVQPEVAPAPAAAPRPVRKAKAGDR
jgi:uncharacterized hydrophobic protein (TIGR00271 family)